MNTTKRMISRPVSVRAEGDKPKTITGTAAVYYDGTTDTEYVLFQCPGYRAIERIMPGAFDDVLGDDVRCLLNHDPSMLLGRTGSGTAKISADKGGLTYECVPPDTQVGRDTLALIARGDITGSSFAFDIGEQARTEQTAQDGSVTAVYEVKRVSRLYDVSPVTYPAYTGTSAGVRSEDEVAEVRSAEEKSRADKVKQLEADRQKSAAARNAILAARIAVVEKSSR